MGPDVDAGCSSVTSGWCLCAQGQRGGPVDKPSRGTDVTQVEEVLWRP